jgi:hypothetical protein
MGPAGLRQGDDPPAVLGDNLLHHEGFNIREGLVPALKASRYVSQTLKTWSPLRRRRVVAPIRGSNRDPGQDFA